MGLTSDPADPRLGRGSDERPEGQNQVYLVLSEEERAKGFVAPLRFSYIHVGERRNTVGEKSGRACNSLTSMNKAIAETYATRPTFYGATFCVACNMHLPVGSEDSGGEFVWANDRGHAEQPHWYVGTLPPEEPCRCGWPGPFDGHVCEETPEKLRLAAIAACPTPEYHETHRYCPSCPWTETLPETADPDLENVTERGRTPKNRGGFESAVQNEATADLEAARESIWTPERESPEGETKLWTPDDNAKVVKGPWSDGSEMREKIGILSALWKRDPQILALVERLTVRVSGDGPLESQVRRWWTLVAVSGVVGALAGLGIGLWLT